jgi:hypothetical protein
MDDDTARVAEVIMGAIEFSYVVEWQSVEATQLAVEAALSSEDPISLFKTATMLSHLIHNHEDAWARVIITRWRDSEATRQFAGEVLD